MFKKSYYIVYVLCALILAVVLNMLSSSIYYRWDWTKEKKYSLSATTRQILAEIKEPIDVVVYLEGDFPSGFDRLRTAVKNVLHEVRRLSNRQVRFSFENPLEGDTKAQQAKIKELISKGLPPTNLKTSFSESLVFPSLIMRNGDREIGVQLLQSQATYSPEEAINHSIIALEYKLVNALRKITQSKKSIIAYTSGHGELEPIDLAKMNEALIEQHYRVARFDLRKVPYVPVGVDVLIVAKPTQPFDEIDKLKLDQYIMHGGKVIWLVESLEANMNQLQKKGSFNLQSYKLRLDDLLFRYGVRINQTLVSDAQFNTRIPLVSGNMRQKELFPWVYYPLLLCKNNHSINKNMDPVWVRFGSSIDTIRNKEVKKTVVLQTSTYAKTTGLGGIVQLDILKEKVNPKQYKQAYIPMGVLLEGTFSSAFTNRLPYFRAQLDSSQFILIDSFSKRSKINKMLVISDGDVIRNDISMRTGPLPLGQDRYTGQIYANEDFLLNSVAYLLDEEKLIDTRNKHITMRLLNRARIIAEKRKWQYINILIPIAVFLIFGVAFQFIRKRRAR